MRILDVYSALCEWGNWSRDGASSLRAKSASLIVMQLVQPANLQSPVSICDEEALRVDHATARLRRYDEKMFEIVELYFLKRLTMKEIELRMKINRSQTEKLFARSLGWLECELEVKAQVA